MNYIYDIVLNFQDNYYQYFEWSKSDKIKNISKISVYHVEDKDLNNLKYNQIKLNNPFLAQIKEDNKKYKKIMCLVSNKKQAIGLLIDKDGTILKRSSLLFEEEDEVNNYCKTLPIIKVNYLENKKVLKKNTLRIELERKDNIINYISKLNDISILKYLYYEYYKKECDNIEIIKISLLKELNKEWNIKQNNLYQLIKLLTKKTSSIKKMS